MGNAIRTREVRLVPEKIRGLFTEEDIPLVFDYLEKRFFLAKGWREFYRKEAAKLQRNEEETEFFFAFMHKYLDYSLQNIRGLTGMGHGFITDKIVVYLMKPRIEAKRREEKELRDFYKRGMRR